MEKLEQQIREIQLQVLLKEVDERNRRLIGLPVKKQTYIGLRSK